MLLEVGQLENRKPAAKCIAAGSSPRVAGERWPCGPTLLTDLLVLLVLLALLIFLALLILLLILLVLLALLVLLTLLALLVLITGVLVLSHDFLLGVFACKGLD